MFKLLIKRRNLRLREILKKEVTVKLKKITHIIYDAATFNTYTYF